MKRALLTLAPLLALAACPPTSTKADGGDHDAGVTSDAGAADAGTELPLEADLLPPTDFPSELLPPGDSLPAALLPPKR